MDSRKVAAGDVFVAVKGAAGDGHHYIEDALAANAGCVVHDAAQEVELAATPGVAVAGLADRLGEIANAYHAAPSAHLEVVAVTGTKGKTTTAYWCAQLLGEAGYVGTLGAGSPAGELAATGMTTPDALALHALLARFVRGDLKAAVIEASSHGLAQRRLAGVDCDVAVFTNLGSDHLDYHRSEREYLAAKLRLFARPEIDAAVINFDDARAAEVASSCAARVLACGAASGNDLSWRLGDDPSHGELSYAGQTSELALPMPGAHNLANAGLAAGAALAAGRPWEQVSARLGELRQLPGRLERIDGAEVTAYVDFAHTAAALGAALGTLRAAHKGARLTCVFGCGGERDASKRAPMGAVAAELADRVIITSDNPRGEEPAAIAAQVAKGAPTAAIVLERAEALARAISEAEPGEVVLVAGKGDEDHIEVAGRRLVHSDRTCVRELLGLA